jgi:hypothetical protein
VRQNELPKKKRFGMQRRLKSFCDDLHAGQRTLTDFLRAVGHTIRFSADRNTLKA